MRALVVADIHYSLRQFDWLRDAAPGFDVVVIAGDLLDLGSAVETDVQIVVVQKYLQRARARKSLFVSSGNHDIQEVPGRKEREAVWLADIRDDAVKADGDGHAVDGHHFTVCPWWDGEEGRGRTLETLRKGRPEGAKSWSWVHHAPPDETPVSWTGKRFGGDAALNGWIGEYGPDFVFSGHIHNAPFYAEGSWICRVGRTWVFNTGRQPGTEPAHILVDFEARTATWKSNEGMETRDLPAGLTV